MFFLSFLKCFWHGIIMIVSLFSTSEFGRPFRLSYARNNISLWINVFFFTLVSFRFQVIQKQFPFYHRHRMRILKINVYLLMIDVKLLENLKLNTHVQEVMKTKLVKRISKSRQYLISIIDFLLFEKEQISIK